MTRFREIVYMVDQVHNAIDRAKQSGTLNAVDRSKQYTVPANQELLKSLNEAWSKIRRLEAALGQRETEIAKLHGKLRHFRIANIALTSVLTGLAWEGIRALATHFLR